MIIGLAGYATVGKTTIANAYIRKYGGGRVGFADALKAAIDPLFPPKTPKDIKRPVYVAYGEAWRKVYPDHWINAVKIKVQCRLQYRPSHDTVVIYDVRYANERNWIESEGGMVVYVTRYGVAAANPTEAASIYEMAPFRHCLGNNGSVDDAVEELRRLVLDHSKRKESLNGVALTRDVGEEIVLVFQGGTEVVVQVVDVRAGHKVAMCVTAPQTVAIYRRELYESIKKNGLRDGPAERTQ